MRDRRLAVWGFALILGAVSILPLAAVNALAGEQVRSVVRRLPLLPPGLFSWLLGLLGAGVPEETLKLLATLLGRRLLGGGSRGDTLRIAVGVGCGFGLAEAVLKSALSVAAARPFIPTPWLSVCLHGLFGLLMGGGLMHEDVLLRPIVLLRAWLLPVLAHAAWDTLPLFLVFTGYSLERGPSAGAKLIVAGQLDLLIRLVTAAFYNLEPGRAAAGFEAKQARWPLLVWTAFVWIDWLAALIRNLGHGGPASWLLAPSMAWLGLITRGLWKEENWARRSYLFGAAFNLLIAGFMAAHVHGMRRVHYTLEMLLALGSWVWLTSGSARARFAPIAGELRDAQRATA